MKLSMCVIMKDAAADIGVCLESVKDGVDEIVVVDTGSEDDSMAIARRYTEKVYSFQWIDDFSAAKNYCLEHATGDWILFLDSDEYLPQEVRGNLRRVMGDLEDRHFDMAEIWIRNVDENHAPLDVQNGTVLRMFRNTPDYRFRDPIHEYVEYTGSGEATRCIVPESILFICHTGYVPSRYPGKFRRNLHMLEALRDRGESKKFLDFYLCGMYFESKDYEKALFHAQQAIEKKDMPMADRFGAWNVWMNSLQILGRDGEELGEVIRRALETYPKAPDFWANYGYWYMNRGDADKAWECLEKAERLMDEFSRNFPVGDSALYRERGRLYHVMSDICLKTGRKDLARHYAELEWEAKGSKRERGYSMLIPARSRCVVEFSCGNGDTGAAFLRIQPECRYVGVDTDKEWLGIAERRLSKTIEASPADIDMVQQGLLSVDCLFYHDRALRDLTSQCFRRHAGHLSEDGVAVFVLENPGYFPRAMQFLAGRESLRDISGFTLAGLQKFIEEAGLAVCSVEAVHSTEDEEEKARPENRELLAAFQGWLGKKEIEDRPDAWARGYIVKAARKQPVRKLFLQAVIGNHVVSGRVRVEEPYAFLKNVPGVFCRMDSKGADLRLGGDFPGKVILRQSLRFSDAATGMQQISAMRQTGQMICYETDEHPMRWEEEYRRSWYLDIIGAHALHVPTRALADAFRERNPHVAVFPNQIAELPPRRVPGEEETVTIFFGSLDREQDWQDIMPVLNGLIREHGDRLKFRVVSDASFFAALQTGNKEFIGNDAYYDGKFVPYGIYADVLDSADISLLPLRDTLFHRMKSDLSFLEAAAHGAVVLASPTVYAATVRDGKTGFLYRDPREFRQKLQRLIKDKKRRRRMADAAYDYVRRERMLSQHYEERLAFYEEMLAKREELDKDLTLRLARLAKLLGRKGD